MWFDAHRALKEIEGGTAPPLVQPQDVPTAQRTRVAIVAAVASTPIEKQKVLGEPFDVSPHGSAFGKRPKTWTGRIVSLAVWRTLTKWERDGPKGQHWNGIRHQWEQPNGNQND